MVLTPMEGINFGKALILDENQRSNEMGIFCSLIGEVQLDKKLPYLAKLISTDTAGGALVVNKNGDNVWIPYISQNGYVPFQFYAVLTSGVDWQGIARTTTPGAKFYFWGGE